MKMKPYYIAPALIFMAVIIGLYVGLGLNPNETAFPLSGQPPPEFSLPALHDGQPDLATSDLTTGQVTVVNFFASWCAPCRVEHPYLMKLAEIEGLQMVGVDFRDTPETAIAYLQQAGNPFDLIGNDADARTGMEWGLAGVPETFIINADGKVVLRIQGPLNEPLMNNSVMPLLEELIP
jgi:cytochrome c biogenesis protein CcmG/thiol:disulfide interchange protein DsbE